MVEQQDLMRLWGDYMSDAVMAMQYPTAMVMQ